MSRRRLILIATASLAFLANEYAAPFLQKAAETHGRQFAERFPFPGTQSLPSPGYTDYGRYADYGDYGGCGCGKLDYGDYSSKPTRRGSSLESTRQLAGRTSLDAYSYDTSWDTGRKFDYGSGSGGSDSYGYDGNGSASKPERRSTHDVAYDFA